MNPTLAMRRLDVIRGWQNRQPQCRGTSNHRCQDSIKCVIALYTDLTCTRSPDQPASALFDRTQQRLTRKTLSLTAIRTTTRFIATSIKTPDKQRRGGINLNNLIAAGAIEPNPRSLIGVLAQQSRTTRRQCNSIRRHAERRKSAACLRQNRLTNKSIRAPIAKCLLILIRPPAAGRVVMNRPHHSQWPAKWGVNTNPPSIGQPPHKLGVLKLERGLAYRRFIFAPLHRDDRGPLRR